MKLMGIHVFSCRACSTEVPVIPRIAELHRLIARILIEKPQTLEGAEIRYLRKFAGKTGREFAELIRIKPETLSRVENGPTPVSPQVDKLVRAVASAARDMKEARRVLLAGTTTDPCWQSFVLKPSSKGWQQEKVAANG